MGSLRLLTLSVFAACAFVLIAGAQTGAPVGGDPGSGTGSGTSSGTGSSSGTTSGTGSGTSSGTGSGTGSSSGTGSGTGTSSGSDSDSDFADFERIFKKVTLRILKIWLGYSPLEELKIAKNLPFTGTASGSIWRIAIVNGEPVAQGTLVGPKSRLGIKIGLYAGSVYAQFSGASANWVALFETNQGAQRGYLLNLKGDAFMREDVVDAEEVSEKSTLLVHGRTLYGISSEGSLFVTDVGALPETDLISWSSVSAPVSKEPLIPSAKIFELFNAKLGTGLVAVLRSAVGSLFGEVAHAIPKSAGMTIANGMAAHKRGIATLADIEQKFSAFDFNNPDLDYDAVDTLFAEYQGYQMRLASTARQMGKGEAFVRDGAWLAMGASSPAAQAMQAFGIGPVFSALIAGMTAPFDFYIRTEDGEKSRITGGTCAPTADEEGNSFTACFTKKVSSKEAKAIEAANGLHFKKSGEAYAALEGIESALFSAQ